MKDKIRNLMFDLADKREIYDSTQNRVITPKEANEVLLYAVKNNLGLNEKSTDRDIKRALRKDQGKEFLEVIEEILDKRISTGWEENEFFNNFVETRSLADGDINEFITEDDVILNVAKVSGDHHDLIMQKLGIGTTYQVTLSDYAVKVGTDIRLFLTGRKDWSTWIDAVARAFRNKIQETIYEEFINAASKLPSALKGTGTLSSAVKVSFDEIIEKVESLNQTEVVIMGTKTALKNLNALAGNGSVDWVSNSQKESIAETGLLGTYEGTRLIAVPQRFKNNSTLTPMIDSSKLWIFPVVSDESGKPVKFVDSGETILEETEIGNTMNDQQSYEVQRRMGVTTVITRYYGEWDTNG